MQSARRYKKLLNKGYKTSNSKARVEDGISQGNGETSDPSKKSRTVHIDVYCTGTELEESDGSNSSTSESDDFTASSPQTVFESGKYRVTHQRATNQEMPYHLRKSGSSKSDNIMSKNISSIPESDVDDTSTAYPSQRSSYSAIKDFGSSFSSVPPSWSTISMSSNANLPDYDSVNTSWKDTFSDVGSLLQSRSSIAQTDSIGSVPRRFLQKKESIDEYPELLQENTAGTSSQASSRCNMHTPSKGSPLYPSDSFEYANSDDKLRIKHMEEMWDGKPRKMLPLDEKHALQHQKLKDCLTKRNKLKKADVSKESDSDDSDISEKAWIISQSSNRGKQTSVKNVKEEDVGSLSDTSPTNRSPSILAIKQRLSLDPTLRAPFMIVPGQFTDQRKIAKKFGQIVNVFKKPGHHVGPAKNPDCLCDHCRTYFQKFGYRYRARSVGDQPLVQSSSRQKDSFYMENVTKDGIMYTDF